MSLMMSAAVSVADTTAVLDPAQELVVDPGQVQPPNPPPERPPGELGTFVDRIIGWIKWGLIAAGVVGLLVCAGMIVIGRKRNHAMAIDGLTGTLWGVGGLALAAGASGIVAVFL
ncbi:hypothetical protein [Pseudonocardia sp. ICBG1293]|uniref:hypothetical protein n=1 Tax=Pseudonocardia sp. ICBG1293 TaxID=2844382 RepID=UPI001CCF2D12|nr:hypothetical protein [Pseudonocardia sp. ICBG1293]